MKQIFYEDVKVGTEVTPLAKIATTNMLVQWAGATGYFDPMFYDEVFAAAHKMGKPIIPGQLKRAWLAQMVTEWIGEAGVLKKVAAYYLKVDHPRHMKTNTEPEEGETWWCKGKVARKYEEDDNHYVECEIWLENGKGEITAPGSATIILPSRA